MGIGTDASLETEKVSEASTDLMLAYRAMVDLGRTVKPDMTRFHRLESRVNTLWSTLSNKEQLAAVRGLIESGHMTKSCADMLVCFEGRVDMSEPPEPCYKIGGKNA